MEADKFDVAFSAVHSLRCRIVYLFDPPWDDMAVRETLGIALTKSQSFEELAERVRQMLESRLVTDIMDAASGLSKALDSHFMVPQCECHRGGMAIFDIINLKLEIYSFYRRVDTMEANMKEYAASTRIGSDGKKSKTVGFSDLYIELRDRVILYWPRSVQFLSIYGMGGASKTTLAKDLFDDRLSSNHFDCRAWVTVGRNTQLKEIARSILAQVGDENLADLSFKKKKKKDENIADQYLKDSLRGRRYLIVLDDVWDEWIETKVAPLLPDDKNSSVVLLTTRLGAVASYSQQIKMQLLNKEGSWNLLPEKVFGEEPCPYQLEKAGKKIAEHCDGLSLTIVKVANLLSKVEKTLQYWNELAAKKNHQPFTAAYNEISGLLLPSYKHLPQILQMCFLYMGVFPQNYEIPQPKLINMWCTDGFLDKISNDDAMNCLDKLISNSVVMIYQINVKHSSLDLYEEQVKPCGVAPIQ